MHNGIAMRSGVAVVALLLAGCAGSADDPIEIGYGANPTLPEPQSSLIPALNVAEATGWEADEAPFAADGLAVTRYAEGLKHPRWLYTLPNGDVLVAETNAPARPDDGGGVRGWVEGLVMGKAGASAPTANRITLLRDADRNGVAEAQTVFLDDLNSPFGMALVDGTIYVANTDGIVGYPYQMGQTVISAEGQLLTSLPAGDLNHHWTKNIIASQDGTKLYATVGSNSNVGENGLDEEAGRAAIWEVDIATGEKREFATGLRNPNGMAWNPVSGELWTAVNERDELGHNLVPDYITSVKDGGFYGWPYSYYGDHVDKRVKPQRPELVSQAIKPDYALGSHTASLGLIFADGAHLGSTFSEGAIIGQHGSWNRKPRSGYKVLFVPFSGGQPSGAEPVDLLSGFLIDNKAKGRPVGVELANDGALLVADDVGNIIWRVSAPVRAATEVAADPKSENPDQASE